MKNPSRFMLGVFRLPLFDLRLLFEAFFSGNMFPHFFPYFLLPFYFSIFFSFFLSLLVFLSFNISGSLAYMCCAGHRIQYDGIALPCVLSLQH